MRKITDDEIRFFDENGYVICRNVLAEDELDSFRRESQRLIDRILERGTREDGMCLRGPEGIPYYLTYLHAQPNGFSLRLLAHPFIGDLLTRMVGPDFVPCYESLVFKLPGNGSSVPWHRDGNPSDGRERIFNIDLYPDHSTVENSCVWVVPGSHLWGKEQGMDWVRRGREDFHSLKGMVPAEVAPGDVLLHHVKVLHGSTANQANSLRRVVYFDNRAVSWNERYRWFSRETMRKRCLLYQHALQQRRGNPYASDDEVFDYTPPEGVPVLIGGEPVDVHAPRTSWDGAHPA